MRLLSTFVFVIAGFLFCQASPDSVRINRLNTKALNLYLSQPDSSITLATQAISLSEKSNNKIQRASSCFILSKAYWARANYLLSIYYGFESLKVFENSKYLHEWGETNLAIARTFIDMKNLTQAKVYINQTLTLANKTRDDRLQADAFREKSMLLVAQKLYDSALFFSNKGMEYYTKQKDNLEVSILYGRKARIYFDLKEYKEAMSFNNTALIMDSLSGNNRALGISYFMKGNIYYALNKKDSSLMALTKSIPINIKIRSLPTMIKTHQLMATIFQERNQLSLANNHLQLASQYKDSLFDFEKNFQIQEILSKYELSSKEKTIQLLENENLIERQRSRNQLYVIVLVSVVAILLGSLSFIFWRMRQWQVRQAKTLQEVSALKSKLFSVISHDLRGPIQNLQSLIEMVTKDYVTQEEFKTILLKLKSSLNISQSTLENLLNWSLSQMEGIRTQKSVFDLNGVICEVINLTKETALKKNISIEYPGKESFIITADINQVQLILRNLLHNAVKFSNQNSIVKIETGRVNRFYKVSIKDAGIGMNKDEIDKILFSNDYFTKTGTDQEKGTGLGLILCKDFIKRNGGELFIESEPNKGTTVSFSLPIG